MTRGSWGRRRRISSWTAQSPRSCTTPAATSGPWSHHPATRPTRTRSRTRPFRRNESEWRRILELVLLKLQPQDRARRGCRWGSIQDDCSQCWRPSAEADPTDVTAPARIRCRRQNNIDNIDKVVSWRRGQRGRQPEKDPGVLLLQVIQPAK